MSDPLVTVGAFEAEAKAAIACNTLESEGIRTFLEDAETATIDWRLHAAIGGVKVRVRQEDVEKAVAILREIYPETPKDPPVEPIEKAVHRAWMAAAYGLMLLPLQIYSIYLVARIVGRPDYKQMPPELHRKIKHTLYIDLWLILWVTIMGVFSTLLE